MGRWFALGETLAFAASQSCAAAVFRLVDTQVGAALGVASSARATVRMINRRGAAALGRQGETPGAGMQALADADRALGYKLRAVALEGRLCMDDVTQSAFGYALANPRAILAYDAHGPALMLMDPDTRVLVVAMGGD